MQLILGALICMVLSGGAVWLVMSWKLQSETAACSLRAEGDIKGLQSTVTELRNNIVIMKAAADEKNQEIANLQKQVTAESELKAGFQSQLYEVRSQLEELPLLRREKELRITAETKLDECIANLEDQKRILADARAQLTDTFSALSADALSRNNDAFLRLARSSFETIQAQAKGELEARQNAVGGLVGPLTDALMRYEKQIKEMEAARQTAYGSLDEHLRALAGVNKELQKETGNLVTALRAPQVRGRWGEMTLRRTAELAGMVDHCDFNLQETVENEGNRQRPDMIVNLPGDRRIVVDAKVPLQAFLNAINAPTEADRAAQLARHGQLVRAHMNQLSARSYWEQFDKAPDVVVLFLPGESFFGAAAEQDPTLIEDGMEKRVLLATPTSLMALLRSVAYGWRQEDIAKNALEISELGKLVHDRIRTFVGHFESLGSALTKSVDSFNKARASLESRVLPAARRFKELKTTAGEEIIEVTPIDALPFATSTSDALGDG